MPIYDYLCGCGESEDFRPMHLSNEARRCVVCGRTKVRIYIKPSAVHDQNSDHKQMARKGFRVLDDSEGFHVNKIAQDRYEKQSRAAKQAAERTIEEFA